MTPSASREAAALSWVARLPLLGDDELAQLLRVPAHRGPEIRLSLERLGWVEWIVPGSHAIAQRRLSFVRPDVLPGLATALGTAVGALSQHVPVRERDTHERIGRLVTTAWVNRFISGLADSRDLGGGHVADARSLPLSLSPGQRWWLPGVDAYACLRAGVLWAPFFVAWDRAAAPDSHRRRQVAAWGRVSPTAGKEWSPVGLPPLLVVAADTRALRVWLRALEGAFDAGERTALTFGVTTAQQMAKLGPAGSIWRSVGSTHPAPLVELLGWGPQPPIGVPGASDLPDLEDGAVRPRRVREWAPTLAVDGSAPDRARIAAVVTATDAEQKDLLQWIARHPLLSAPELSELLGESLASVEHRLRWLVRCGTCSAVRTHERSLDDSETRYVLAEFGLRVLATDAHVGRALFIRDGGITFVGSEDKHAETRVLRHREHTLGLNAFMTQFASDARAAGGHLVEWRNEAESTQRLVADGRISWIRPDASGLLVVAGSRYPFIVEYDRGTLDAGDYRPKLDAYSRYFAARAWESAFESEPSLLFACADARAEERVGRALRLAGGNLAVVTTSVWRYAPTQPSSPGLLGPVWRTPRSDSRRRVFLPEGG